MRVLRPFQEKGVEYLRSRPRGLLFDDPGLGKSTQALSAIGDRAIVVCPASVKATWVAETGIVRPDLCPSVLKGRSSFRVPEKGEIIIMNPELLPEAIPPGLSDVDLVLDEAQVFKTTTSQRSKKVRQLATFTRRAWAMTGTPIQSYPQDLYGITHSIRMEGVWGGWSRFLWLFRGFQTQWGIRWGKPRGEVVDIMKAHFLGRSRKEVAPELPSKTYTKIPIRTGRVKEAEGISDERLMREYERIDPGGELSKARAALALAKARSPELHDLLGLWTAEAPLLIFSQHVDAAKEVAARLDTVALTGETPTKMRDILVSNFKAGKSKVLVGTVGAMGVGLTLTEAWRVVFLDRAWNPSDNTQAEDRSLRIGQEMPVQIIDLVSSEAGLDEAVFRLLRAKSKIINESVEAARG